MEFMHKCGRARQKARSKKVKVYSDETITYTQEYFLNEKPVFQSLIIWIIITLIVSAFLCITFLPFEEVVKVSGSIRPEDNISQVSNAVTGRIKFIAYKSGMHVKKGTLLLEIDPTQLEAQKESLITRIADENEKLSALYEIKESILKNKNLIDNKHYEAYLRYEVWQTNLSKLQNIKNLSKEKFKQEKRMPSSMTTESRIRELEADYLISCNNFDDYNISFQHQIESEIMELTSSSKINNAQLKQIQDSLLFTKVIAPIDGIIQEVSLFNVNDWIQSGQHLFNLIPDEENLTKIELLIPAKQAGKLECGCNVKMRFPSLPYHEFGGTEGKILVIAPDTIHSQNGEALFIIKVDHDKKFLTDHKGKKYPLKVGLQVDARIIISKTTIIKYILEKLNLWY